MSVETIIGIILVIAGLGCIAVVYCLLREDERATALHEDDHSIWWRIIQGDD